MLPSIGNCRMTFDGLLEAGLASVTYRGRGDHLRLLRIAVLAALLAPVANAGLVDASVTEVVAPSGRPGYSLKCSGWGRNIVDCYRKAVEVCPHGYDVERQYTGTTWVPSPKRGVIIAPKNSMIISCRDKLPDKQAVIVDQAQPATPPQEPAPLPPVYGKPVPD